MKIPSRVKRKAPSCSSSFPFSDKAQPFSGNTPTSHCRTSVSAFYRCSPYSTYGSDNKFIVAGRLIQILYFESTAVFLYTFYICIDGRNIPFPCHPVKGMCRRSAPQIRYSFPVGTVVTRVLARTAEIRNFIMFKSRFLQMLYQ